jgi:hypothetical protein
MENLKLSEYVTLVVTVPETHADTVREAMMNAGAGKWGNYTHCSFRDRGRREDRNRLFQRLLGRRSRGDQKSSSL